MNLLVFLNHPGSCFLSETLSCSHRPSQRLCPKSFSISVFSSGLQEGMRMGPNAAAVLSCEGWQWTLWWRAEDGTEGTASREDICRERRKEARKHTLEAGEDKSGEALKGASEGPLRPAVAMGGSRRHRLQTWMRVMKRSVLTIRIAVSGAWGRLETAWAN